MAMQGTCNAQNLVRFRAGAPINMHKLIEYLIEEVYAFMGGDWQESPDAPADSFVVYIHRQKTLASF